MSNSNVQREASIAGTDGDLEYWFSRATAIHEVFATLSKDEFLGFRLVSLADSPKLKDNGSPR
jgi:hypothetical protein